MKHNEGMHNLSKIFSALSDEVGISLKSARSHNLPQAIAWLRLAKKDIIRAEKILLGMRHDEKRDALKYYN